MAGTIREIVHLSSDGAFTVDQDLRITAWNSRARAILGYREGEVLGQFCGEVLCAASPDGRAICSPQCVAAKSFLHGLPFGEREVVSRDKRGGRVKLGLSSLVLPAQQISDGTLAIVFLRSAEEDPSVVPERMLRIYTLGSFRLFCGQALLLHTAWKRKQAASLLKYLVSYRGRPVHREVLAEHLWPETPQDVGLERLKVIVYSLRQQLRNGFAGAQHAYIVSEGQFYRLSADRVWVDVDAFDQLADEGQRFLRAGEGARAQERYQAAAALYRGPYLEEEIYADWCAPERERLTEKYLSVLTQIAALSRQQGSPGDAIAAYRKALEVDPCRESVQRALMQSLWDAGRRDEALRQYRTCQRVLRAELDIEPLPETTSLYRAILQNEPLPAVALT